jgi:threonylcarbamoyladenosine tRNA methylthiotransferase MtaB
VIKTGIKEIVLTGVNIGDFGRQNNESFLDLLKALDRVSDIPRIRISSIEPDLLSDEIITFIGKSERIMPHFHLPLQSGSDKVLVAMKRKYNRDLFTSRVQKIHSILPLACIASDVIVGFPGESDNDFAETSELIEKLDISYLHVFSYSSRENTLASKMIHLVPETIKKERSEVLHALSDKKKKAFYLKNMGHEAQVLFESADSNGLMHGFTGNYIKVGTPFNPILANQIKRIKLDRLDKDMKYIVREDDFI